MHVLSVGSSVIDLFLSVDPAHVEIGNKKVTLNLGDKVPSDIKKLALGGNGANVAVGLTRLEVPTTFYTYLGSDILSREIEESLTKEGVALVAERGKLQNAPLHIILDFDSDRVILSHYEKADHGFSYSSRDNLDYIFLNSIAEPWEDAYQKVYDFAATNNIPFALSLGSRQLDDLNDLIYKMVKSTKIFFSNLEEAAIILKTEEKNIKKLLTGVKALGPEIVSITDGANGAYAIDANNNIFKINPAPSDGKEKTGAGDAYAAAFFAAIMHGAGVPKAMLWGTLNSAGVMEQIGAQTGLLSKKTLDERLANTNNLEAEEIK